MASVNLLYNWAFLYNMVFATAFREQKFIRKA